MFDWKLYIAVILFILLIFINKHEPFIVSDDITDNILIDTNVKTIGENANTNSIKKNNEMVNQINAYDKQNDVVLKSLNECIAGETILQKNFELINKFICLVYLFKYINTLKFTLIVLLSILIYV